MKLMTLPPESQRLRRIARAHAAGEFSRSEYRQARRVLLEELARSGSSTFEDTFRRSAHTARRDAAGVAVLEVTRGDIVAPRGRHRPFRWFVGVLGFLIGLMWLIPALG